MVRQSTSKKRRLTNKYREVQQLVQRGRSMSFADKSRQSVDRKTRRNLDFIRNRGVEEMGPTTRANANKPDADPGSERHTPSLMALNEGDPGRSWRSTAEGWRHSEGAILRIAKPEHSERDSERDPIGDQCGTVPGTGDL